MVGKLPELWVATDDGGQTYLWDGEPDFNGDYFTTKCIYSQTLIGNLAVPPGHKVRYVAQDMIDCRPKPQHSVIVPEQIGDTAWRIRFKMRDGRYVTFFIMVDCNGTITHAPRHVNVLGGRYDLLNDNFENCKREILEIDPDASFRDVTAAAEE